MEKRFEGIYPILYAFFDREGRLDREAMRRQTDACVRNGAHGIAALGLATEVGKLSLVERHTVMEWLLADVAGRRVLPDLEANGHAAVVVARPTDERACQVKGTFVGVRPVKDSDRARAARQWSAFLDSLEYIGIPRVSASTWITEVDVAIRLKVTAIFEQTPGPEAGKALASGPDAGKAGA